MNPKKEVKVRSVEEEIQEYIDELILILDDYSGIKGSKIIPIYKQARLIYKAEEGKIYIEQKNRQIVLIDSLGIGYIGHIIDYLTSFKQEKIEQFDFSDRLFRYFDQGSMEVIKNKDVVLGYIGKKTEEKITYIVYASIDETMSVLSCMETPDGDPDILISDLKCISSAILSFSKKLAL